MEAYGFSRRSECGVGRALLFCRSRGVAAMATPRDAMITEFLNHGFPSSCAELFRPGAKTGIHTHTAHRRQGRGQQPSQPSCGAGPPQQLDAVHAPRDQGDDPGGR